MIENIIFDFGGVILDIDYSQTDIHLGGLINRDKIYFEPFKTIFEEYEVGIFGERRFLDKLKSAIGNSDLEDEILITAWNSMLGPTYAHRLEMLSALQSRFRTFLLSNTNETHLDCVKRQIRADFEIVDFDSQYFEKVYYSHLIQRRKPDVSTYLFVIKDAGIDPTNTLFIDDSLENVLGARNAGLLAIQHDRNVDITTVIDQYLINP